MTYEFDGKKYGEASAHQREWGAQLVAELDLQGTERILDLGCGDGALSAQIADLVPNGEVVGIDASRGMVEATQLKGRKNLRFLLMDINELNYCEQFDVVFSNAALHWIKDHKHLLRNVGRALRKGGRLRFNFAGEGNCSHFFSVIREAMSAEEFGIHFAGFDWPWYMPSVAEYSVHHGCQWNGQPARLGRKCGQILSGRKGNDQVDRPAEPRTVSCACPGPGQNRFPGVCDQEND